MNLSNFLNLRYVVMENMKNLLSSFDYSKPQYIGSRRHFKPYVKKGYHEGGSGIYIST